MKGKHKVIIQNRKLRYDFEIKRNITIIKGDSGTGKTTLINMIRQAANLGKSSGVQISCDVACLPLEGATWKIVLQNYSNTIFFIDEENSFIKSEDFASEVQKSDNYFVIITRENLYNLPYSVEEIYGIHSSGKYQMTKKVYHEFYQIYSMDSEIPVIPKQIVVEDSNSGYDFFSAVAEESGMNCISAGGKTKLFDIVTHLDKNIKICVIADGAAIGAEMNRLYKVVEENQNVSLYLPESFEWILLRSGLIEGNELSIILSSPEEYIESQEFFSWERFFTKVLVEMSKDTRYKYNKKQLNPIYLHSKAKKAILDVIEGIKF